MSNRSRINSLEKKLNIKQIEIIVAFSDDKSVLVKKESSGEINRKFKNLHEVKSFYKDKNAMLINVKNFQDFDEEAIKNITGNIEAHELNKQNELNYDEMLELVKQKAELIHNLS